jgi:hypothetical protein
VRRNAESLQVEVPPLFKVTILSSRDPLALV